MHDADLTSISALVDAAFTGARFTAEPMPGGASTRRYFRVHLEGAARSSAVAMHVPDATRGDEIEKGGPPPRWPFLEVRELLAQHGIDVPGLHADLSSSGWILLEDLGDDTLARVLARAPEAKTALYQTAVRDLARAQIALEALPPASVVGARAFDEDLLYMELDHFREWGLDARGKALGRDDRARFEAIAGRLAHRIAALPRGFVHRDYQSRNLMVRGEHTLVWIDFQDALLGPRVYDLVALLNDSYQHFSPEFVAARLDDYAAARGLSPDARAALGREFDLVTVQRKLKDAGRFVYIDRVRKNPSFLAFVLPTVHKVNAALDRLRDEPDMVALADLLRRAGADQD